MPRQSRYPLAGLPQHILQRGHNREVIFFNDKDYRQYLDCLWEAATRHQCAVHAYVLMPNHVHLLITPSDTGGISKLMQSLGRCYVRYLNDTYRRTGTLWEGRFKACPVDPDTYLLECYRYIERNPVRTKTVAHAIDYPWSSYAAHAHGKLNAVITDHAQYLALGRTHAERQSAYRRLFECPIDEATVTEIRESCARCLVLGHERFKDRIERALARRVRPGRVGRPRKSLVLTADSNR